MRIFLLCFLLLLPHLGMADELTDLQSVNFLLKSELQLAKSAKLYIFIDLPEKAILFKAGGVVLKRLPIDDLHAVGSISPLVLRTLSAKKAEKQPKRQEVKIATEAEILSAPLPAPGVDTLVALEIDDMPETYQLVLSDGLTVQVKPSPAGDFKTKSIRYWRDAVETVHGWYHSLLLKMHGEVEPMQITMNLSGADARQFYWSFDEGMSCLIKP